MPGPFAKRKTRWDSQRTSWRRSRSTNCNGGPSRPRGDHPSYPPHYRNIQCHLTCRRSRGRRTGREGGARRTCWVGAWQKTPPRTTRLCVKPRFGYRWEHNAIRDVRIVSKTRSWETIKTKKMRNGGVYGRGVYRRRKVTQRATDALSEAAATPPFRLKPGAGGENAPMPPELRRPRWLTFAGSLNSSSTTDWRPNEGPAVIAAMKTTTRMKRRNDDLCMVAVGE